MESGDLAPPPICAYDNIHIEFIVLYTTYAY